MRVKTDFQIYEKKHRSGRVSYLVNAGTINGKRHLPPFETRDEAEHYRAKLIEKRALENPVALSDLTTLAAVNVRAALERLKPYEASITEAVDFFIKFSRPPKGKITIQEAMDLFEKLKTQEGLSSTYLKNSKRTFFVPFREAFKNCLMNDVTAASAHGYVYGKSGWSKETKNSHIRHLRALYSFVISKRHATLNPFAEVPFVKNGEAAIEEKILTVEEAQKLLQFALDKGLKAECAAMALILFCGIRVEEVERVSWEHIHLDAKKQTVDLKRGKNGRRRVNQIPENALWWLKACRSEKGPVAPKNYTKAMQRLRRKAEVAYKQNAARHSFASYHIAFFEDATKTAMLLGHPNAALLYSTYRQLVKEAEAAAYWKIVPASVTAEWERVRKEADEAAKLQAEMDSNCGRAIRNEDGEWRPMMEESIF